MLRTAGGLFLAGIGPCVLFIAFAPLLFTVYLGPDWREAGEIARILAPMLLLQMVVSPVSTVFLFTNNQKLDLWLTLAATALLIGAAGGAMAAGSGASGVIWAYAMAQASVYLAYIIVGLRLSGP
jgi:O-antigen/teichoic acid export membrane protein